MQSLQIVIRPQRKYASGKIILRVILFEDKYLLAINKPAGLMVEKDRFGHPSVEGMMADYLHRGNAAAYTGIIHRLDRPVSGVLLIAKKKSALRAVQEQFREGGIRKTYMALVARLPEPPSATLTQFLYKDTLQKKALITGAPGPHIAPVKLDYRTERAGNVTFLLRIVPYTGKYHQIRAQLASIGCPVIGDALYGSEVPFRENAICLHAVSLRFTHPNSGEEMELSADIPDTWELPSGELKI